ncbi:MAG TPA: hypothetical protein VK071_03015, partial [Tissierellales bacterium]|nr:hypothetical protein [Tissierellales bacterium]
KERRIYITPRKYIHGGGENNFMGGGENNFLDNNTSINITSINSIYAFWNTQKIINHRKLTDKMKRKIRTSLKDYKEEEIKQSIKNYSEILNSDKYWFTYRWTIDEFLQRGIEKFIDREVAKQNYLDESKIDKKQQSKGEHNPYKHMKIYE